MSNHTPGEKRWAEKKLEIAIDKMIALQDKNFGDDAVTRILEMLNAKLNQVRS